MNHLVEQLVLLAYRLVEAERITLFVVDDVNHKLICRVSRDGLVIEVPIGKVPPSKVPLKVPPVICLLSFYFTFCLLFFERPRPLFTSRGSRATWPRLERR